MNARERSPWWRGAVLYQVYPRSFQDTDGDGIGDLAGVVRHLDHIASLGVDGVWISPFFRSPMRDFGYDVSDFRAVDPVFGTLADFDALVVAAHARGLRVVIDQIYAHSSIDHPWFTESRDSRANPKADWYVWADPKPDGMPPNNWQSVFGGPAWTWDGRRRQYYMHTFLKEQPQLNVRNPAVQDALLAVAEFWLRRGVDGFRLDALNHAMVDPALRDNPPADDDGPRTRPFDFQQKLHSQSQPEILDFIERISALCDRHGAIFTLAEVGGAAPEAEQKAYTAGTRRLSAAYNFDFLGAPSLDADFVAKTLAPWCDGEGEPCWAFENHDAPRALSRWATAETMRPFARMKMALLLALRGNVVLYQGEELGLEQDEIPYALLQDPEAIANWPLTLSRDGARTPMPWTDGPNGGFSEGTPWLPLGAANRARAVSVQAADEASLLALTRRLLACRRETPALRVGRLDGLHADGALLAFDRVVEGQRIRCLFNLGSETLVMAGAGHVLFAVNGATVDVLPAFSAAYLVVAPA
ncbi:MAG: alpha glucosidase [Zavarzinia sp.]|nr:alpha glucosidase [Zavarzinia sp.]